MSSSSEDKYIQLGILFDQMGEFDKAIACFTQAIKINPNNGNNYYNRGVAYGHMGDWDNAIADYTKAIELNPNDSEAYGNRAMAYLDKKDYNKAIADLTQCLAINPYSIHRLNLPEVFYFRANNSLEQGDYEQAILDYSLLIETFPDYYAISEVYINRARAYLYQKKYDKFKNDLKKATKILKDMEDCEAKRRMLKEIDELCKQYALEDE